MVGFLALDSLQDTRRYAPGESKRRRPRVAEGIVRSAPTGRAPSTHDIARAIRDMRAGRRRRVDSTGRASAKADTADPQPNSSSTPGPRASATARGLRLARGWQSHERLRKEPQCGFAMRRLS